MKREKSSKMVLKRSMEGGELKEVCVVELYEDV